MVSILKEVRVRYLPEFLYLSPLVLFINLSYLKLWEQLSDLNVFFLLKSLKLPPASQIQFRLFSLVFLAFYVLYGVYFPCVSTTTSNIPQFSW